MIITEIQKRINTAKDLDFGSLFNNALELFKKVWVQGLVVILLNMILVIPVIMIVYLPLVSMGIFAEFGYSYDSYDDYLQPDTTIPALLIITFIVLYIFVIIALSAIAFGLKAAFYKICKLKDLDEMGKEDYFYFFKKPYLSKTIKISLAYLGISLLATLLCFLPIIYAFVPLSYMLVVYAFNPDKSISEIINISFKLGNKKWLISFGLLLVSLLLAEIIGMIMCIIGIFVTASFTWLPPYHIYKEVIGFDKDNEVKQIEQNSTFQ